MIALLVHVCNASTWTDSGNYDSSWYNDLSSSFNIATPEQLAGVVFLSNNGTSFQGKTINITSNIDMAKYDWSYINSFSGELNGNGYCISNIHYKYSTTNVGTYVAGIFKDITSTGNVHNVKFDNISIIVTNEYGQGYAGGIACTNYGIINNCEVLGYVSANYKGSTQATFDDYFAGGIVAHNFGTVINCTHDGAVESLPSHYSRYPKAYAGGIVGKNEGIVANCVNYGSVYARVGYSSSSWNIAGSFPSAFAGGICGANTSELQNVVNFANVTATSYQLGNNPGYNAYGDGICPSGGCTYAYYSSSSTIAAPSLSKNGTMLSLDQLQNKTLNFTALLNSNLLNISVEDLSCWGNSNSFRNNQSFIMNNVNISVKGTPTSQNSIFVEAAPDGIESDAIQEKGFEYSILNEQTSHKVICTDDFSVELLGLSSATLYNVRAYITTAFGTMYSIAQSIQTNSLSVETLVPTEITPISANLHGKANVGSTPILSQGFLWKDSQSQYKVVYSEGRDFSYSLDGLKPSTTYFCQSFIVTQSGQNIYGNEINFSTAPISIYIDNWRSSVDELELNGHINLPISTQVIVEYKKKGTSTYSNKTAKTNQDGIYSIVLEKLESAAEYDVRAYFIYQSSYIYSATLNVSLDKIEITTLAPTISEKIYFSGKVNGNITNGELGFEYRDVISPDIIPSTTLIASIVASDFYAETTNATNGVTYKVRAYYKSIDGALSYGNWITFKFEGFTSDMSVVSVTKPEIISIIDVSGYNVNKLRPGINIVIYSDGSVKKILK